jgi:phospholipid/cholesterol/gamma-HCH transport system substrate-binding protein
MAKQNDYSLIRVGILISVALGILAFGIIVIGHGAQYLSGSIVFEAHFQRINNLQPGAPVTLVGVNVGAVQSIYFPADPKDRYIIVKMWIDHRGAQRIRSDAQAEIRTMGMLGDKYIELSSGTETAPLVKSGQVLKAENPVGYETILGGFKGSDDLVANLLAISISIRNISQAVEKDNGLAHQILYGEADQRREAPSVTLASMRHAVDNAGRAASALQEVLQKMSQGKGVAAALLSDKTNGQAMLANVSKSVFSLRHASEALDQVVTRYDKANGTMPRLMMDEAYGKEVTGNLEDTSRELQQVVHKINSGQGTLGLLINDPSLYRHTEQLLSGNASGISVLRTLWEMFGSRRERETESDRHVSPASLNDRSNGVGLRTMRPAADK